MFRFIVTCVFLCGPFAAVAQATIALGGLSIDANAPVEVTSERLTVDQDSGAAVFDGNVLVLQGALRLAAAQVAITTDAATNQITRMQAFGGVTFVTAEDAAEADSADYDLTSGLLTLQGNVLLTQGQSTVFAESMAINVSDGTATMQGRVRTVLQPGAD